MSATPKRSSLVVGSGIAVGAVVALALVFQTDQVNINQLPDEPNARSAYGTSYDYADYEYGGQADILPMPPLSRTHTAQFVARGDIIFVDDPRFNTEDGHAPDMDPMSYSPYESPFESMGTEPASEEELDEILEAWRADGKLASPMGISRVAVVQVHQRYKGSDDLDYIVVLLPGGVITETDSLNTHVGMTFANVVSGMNTLAEDDEVILFSRDAQWFQDEGILSAYPAWERCFAKAEELVSGFGPDSAACHSILGAYRLVDGVAVSKELGPDGMAISAVQTEVARAVATEPITASIPFLDEPNMTFMQWPVPSSTP